MKIKLIKSRAKGLSTVETAILTNIVVISKKKFFNMYKIQVRIKNKKLRTVCI